MKTALTMLAAYAAGCVFMWLFIGFVAMDWNVVGWDGFSRFAMLWIALIAPAVVGTAKVTP